MKTNIVSLLMVVALLAISGCATPEKESPRALKPLKCIAVMPVMAGGEDVDLPLQDLQKGAAFATSEMTLLLADRPNIELVSSRQAGGFPPEIIHGRSGAIAAIGEQTGCDGVLLTHLEYYSERVGSEYSVDSPASASFKMALFYAPTGAVLWTADFRETQESFLSNIFSSKMGKRGFRWITAQELLRQGLEERLGECPYLK
ncbi:hypothetical protein JWG39_02480 [Desulforhopalus vacuolatus]|uniref:hypothetical protein n=1 Tax=Desulforhopalus vacuolatus TaxID=40414 RepID=UPI001963BB67|nr:hypothetical protein [Desulforhopalus vacuolatus]MBM9518683.1 hypothetical protein [Desulforhopalus vacuolatus]